MPVIECVPNFSEGRNMAVIRQITNAIESVGAGVRLLHVDPGQGANRTVVTFAGNPEAVVEAAFRGAKRAAEVIDMRSHHGTHPRQGATDVLPLVPISGITLEECAQLARQLARRLADEAGIPCYAYEAAALRPNHRNLADCRAGEYEALAAKLADADRRPDYLPPTLTTATSTVEGGSPAFIPASPVEGGSPAFIPEAVLRSGFSVVGARKILLAVNFNLNTANTSVAKAIAREVRAKGGSLPCTKAIGWFIDEYGIAQVSMNMTDLSVTPLHVAFEEVSRRAKEHGVSVTGTEIVGLVPLKTILDAGRYFLQKQHLPLDLPEEAIVDTAISNLGLSDLRPFVANEKIIEYRLK